MPLFYARARPEIDLLALQAAIEPSHALKEGDTYAPEWPDNGLEFNSARAGLKWLLTRLRAQRQKSLSVGVQALTCPVILSAILESGNLPVFLDISREHLSSPLNEVSRSSAEVLILTHLSGIPNPDYAAIAKECKRRNVLLIEDLAQTWGASVCGAKVGTLGDVALLSFGFDKPISAFRGGMLWVNESGALPKLLPELHHDYRELPQEASAGAAGDLYRLSLYYDLTEPDAYQAGLNYYSLADAISVRQGKSGERIQREFGILQSLPAYRVFDRIYGKACEWVPIRVQRLGEPKKRYLGSLFATYEEVAERRRQVALRARAYLEKDIPGLEFPGNPGSATTAPCRLTALARSSSERDDIIARLRDRGIEAGGFNWSYLVMERFHPRVLAHRLASQASQFPNAKDVSSRILNLPIWSESIWA
jgi:dTDP-4-amino-4,6-dideoxygalactose transaminase